jgi:hypothetical protein
VGTGVAIGMETVRFCTSSGRAGAGGDIGKDAVRVYTNDCSFCRAQAAETLMVASGILAEF